MKCEKNLKVVKSEVEENQTPQPTANRATVAKISGVKAGRNLFSRFMHAASFDIIAQLHIVLFIDENKS